MKNDVDVKGRWALVTGSSSGLGADFARKLAALGCNLVLVARREARLNQLKEELERAHGVSVRVVVQDLSELDAAQSLYQRLIQEQIQVDILVNNAGFGAHGQCIEIAPEKQSEMLMLNVVSLAQLTRLFAKEMVARGFGRILQLASTASFQPVPSMAAYGASKAFVLSFGEALAYELRGTGVTCTVLCPGFTATEFMEVSGVPLNPMVNRSMMTSQAVARSGIAAMLRGRTSLVAGLSNALQVFGNRLVSRRVSAAIANRFLQSPQS